MNSAVVEAIVRAAREAGIDPKYALAYAQRESSFNPNARSSKTIRGLFQMRGDHRMNYGRDEADSADPYTQTKMWSGFIKDVKKEMAGPLGRDPSDAEGYLGHHFGGVRAGRMMRMDPMTPVDTVFTPEEMRINPHFAKAGTVGNLNRTILADIEKRAKGFNTGESTSSAPDLPSNYGELVDMGSEPIQTEASTAPPARVPGQAPPQSGVRRDAPPAAAPIAGPMQGIGQALAPQMAATIPSELIDRLQA